ACTPGGGGRERYDYLDLCDRRSETRPAYRSELHARNRPACPRDGQSLAFDHAIRSSLGTYGETRLRETYTQHVDGKIRTRGGTCRGQQARLCGELRRK